MVIKYVNLYQQPGSSDLIGWTQEFPEGYVMPGKFTVGEP